MCSDCHAAVCPAACPYYRAKDERRAVCSCCNEPIFEDDGGYYGMGDSKICLACADVITVEELIEIARLSGMEELLTLIGFRYYA
jgi:hypothetical protein